MKSRCILQGIGAALLLMFYYRRVIEPSHFPLFHHGFPVTHLIGGYLLDMLGVAVLITALLLALQYLPPVPRRVTEALFAGAILWRVVDVAVGLQTSNGLASGWLGVRRQSLIGVLLFSIVLGLIIPRITLPVVRAVRLALAAFAFSGLWTVPQLIRIALIRSPVQAVSAAQVPSNPGGGSDRRIIWILFDELSYDQTFDHPYPGIELPNLRRLRSESVSFSKLEPAGFYTQLIIPSLFLGTRIDKIGSTLDGGFLYEDASSGRWLAYDPRSTLFALAQSKGWRPGMDEWNFPYCRILASVLDDCSWEPTAIFPMELDGASEDQSVWANAAILPQALLGVGKNHSIPAGDASFREYHEILEHARTLIADSRIRFVFLHLPIPHPPGIYDRRRHVLRNSGTYLDNLVLADDTLGLLLQQIDAAGASSRTTVIVSSDHSWRISLFRNDSAWSAEEERACGGHFDDRPVLLIRFPGQNAGVDVNERVPEMLEHDMIAGMLRGEISRPADVIQLEQQRRGAE